MSQVNLSLEKVYQIAYENLKSCGCDHENADAVANTIRQAEADLCHAHGLFRLPGYLASLKSGKVDGAATTTIEKIAPAVIRADAHNGFAPLALKITKSALIETAKSNGIAALALVRVHHFSALWMEVEALADKGCIAFAFTSFKPAVAPAGGKQAIFGTNPMAFGWPRVSRKPLVFDQASAALAKGEVMIAARDNKPLPLGIGIDEHGEPTTDADEILKGAILPFGGYKGASIAMMIELLAGPLIGEQLSLEAAENDVNDGGPPQGGEFIIAIDPSRFGDADFIANHGERLFSEILMQPGTRLPADRRYENRENTKINGISIPTALLNSINKAAGVD